MHQANTVTLPFADIQVNVVGLRNPRHHLEDVDQLAESIKDNGLQYPLTVWEYTDVETDETKYALAAGFRRHAAITQLIEEVDENAFRELTVVVLDGSLEQALGKNLEENIQRSRLNAGDEILAVSNLYDRVGDQTEVGKMVGKSQSWVSQKVSLKNRLIPRALSALRTDQINLPQAKKLAELTDDSGAPNEEVQNMVLGRILNPESEASIPTETTERQKTHRTKREVEAFRTAVEEWLGEAEEEHHRDRAYTMESCIEWMQCGIELRDLGFLVRPALDEDPQIIAHI